MHTIEKELIKATGYKAKGKFANRQEYLKSIFNAVLKLDDDDFNALSDEAATWANEAVTAHNSKNDELPDFDEAVASEDEDDEADASDDAAEDADEASEDETAEADEDEPDDEDEPSEDDESDEDEDESDAEPEEEVKPKAKKAPAKKPELKKAAKAEKPAPAKKPAKAAPKAKAKAKGDDDEEDVVLDKWGAMEGSKNSRALALFEKGATTKEVKDALGGTYYNILKKMAENGHTIEKEGSLITLTHKDDTKQKAPAKKKK